MVRRRSCLFQFVSSLPLTSAEKRAECLETKSFSSWSRLQSMRLVSQERIPTQQNNKEQKRTRRNYISDKANFTPAACVVLLGSDSVLFQTDFTSKVLQQVQTLLDSYVSVLSANLFLADPTAPHHWIIPV